MSDHRVRRVRTDTRPERGGITRPVRDTGLTVGRRGRHSARRERSPYPALTLVIAVLGLGVLGWMLSWGAPKAESGASETASASVIPAVPGAPERTPTPLFADADSVLLRLPVDPKDITALAFHQASGDRAIHIGSLVPDADMDLANELKAVPPVDSGGNVAEDTWDGVCLRLWRSNRGGMPDTAADVGALAGTDVYTPVTGTVVEVRPYLLYEKYDDFEIHIQPDGHDDVDVVLIHVDDVSVKAGDRVKAGVTRIAAIRLMSDKLDLQLGGYTGNGGDHVHMQLNRIETPGVLDSAGGS